MWVGHRDGSWRHGDDEYTFMALPEVNVGNCNLILSLSPLIDDFNFRYGRGFVLLNMADNIDYSTKAEWKRNQKRPPN
jgi:hypothetical protein